MCEWEGEEGWLGVVRPNDYFTDSTGPATELGARRRVLYIFTFRFRRTTLYFMVLYGFTTLKP